MPGLEDPERAAAAQARLERLQRACGGLMKPEARFMDLSDAHMGAAQQTLYELTGTDAICVRRRSVQRSMDSTMINNVHGLHRSSLADQLRVVRINTASETCLGPKRLTPLELCK